MSPGRRPSPWRASQGDASEITATPTAITSSHFSIGSFARVAAPLEGDADLAHVADVPELGDREPHPRRLELAGDDAADVFGERLQQPEAALRELGHHARDVRAVVHRVVDVVGAADLVAGDADLDVHLEGLRPLLLPLVDAHPGVDAELPDEDRIHGRVL